MLTADVCVLSSDDFTFASERAEVQFAVRVEDISPVAGLCPSVLRRLLLGGLSTNPLKCCHRTIPVIGDMEYDIYIKTFAPPKQLIIVSVMSTKSVKIFLLK